MTDSTHKPTEGFFKIEQLDADRNVIDVWEDQNMIMKLSKSTVASSTKGDTVYDSYIDTFVLGNGGTIDGDLLTPRTFSYERTNLFAEENLANGLSAAVTTYPITFNPTALDPNDGSAVVTDEGASVGGTPIEWTKINVTTVDDSTIVYVIEIPTTNANDSGAIAWTEAALYTKEGEDLTATPKKIR